jgi:hypothetical protein
MLENPTLRAKEFFIEVRCRLADRRKARVRVVDVSAVRVLLPHYA